MPLHISYSVLVARPSVLWKENGEEELTLMIKMVNNQGIWLLTTVGAALMSALYVGVLWYVHFKFTIGIILLLPALLGVLGYAVYRALSPIEEYTFKKDGTCRGSLTGLFSIQQIVFNGVTGVQAKMIEFADGLTSGGERTSEALKLAIYHEEGVHLCETMWPTRESKLAEAAMAINDFLASYVLVEAPPVVSIPERAPIIVPPSAIVTEEEGGMSPPTSVEFKAADVELVDVELNESRGRTEGIEPIITECEEDVGEKKGGGGSGSGGGALASGPSTPQSGGVGTPSNLSKRAMDLSTDLKGLVQEAHKGVRDIIEKTGDAVSASLSPRAKALLATISPRSSRKKGEGGGAASPMRRTRSARSFTELDAADSRP